MKWLSALGLCAVVAGAVIACGARDRDGDGEDQGGSDLVSITRADDTPQILVKDPTTLVALEARFSLASMLGASGESGAELSASSTAYQAIVDAVMSDVKGVLATDKAAGKGFAFSHRLFDEKWLASPEARFELTGIANRIDLEHRGGCGEIHFVYRMAYTHQPGDASTRVDSRLPFTVNVLVPIKDDGVKCTGVAQAWENVRGDQAASDLLAGPLAAIEKPSHVEINYQLVRWPSTTRPDMGGHAEYVLRSFEAAPGALTPTTLDDTPRTDLDTADRAELRAWIGDNLAAIDDGTAQVPKKFLATTVKSVAPRSSVRLANKPFTALFAEADLASLPLSGTTTVKSPAALLHKLDGMTCEGCHQSRGIAGFHLLGEERLGTVRLNALAVGASAHTLDAVAWRKTYVDAVAKGGTRPKRLPPDHASGAPGGFGAHCSLGKDPGFEGWSCKDGLVCKHVDEDRIGHCLPKDGPNFGDACEDSSVSASLDPHADKVTTKNLTCNGGATCQHSGSGFPDGVCQSRCANLGQKTGDVVCSGVPFGTGPLGGFNNCLFTLKKPFQVCLADDVRPTSSRACDDQNPCRDDYVCARIFIPSGSGGGGASSLDPLGGACMPPYFVFQGRVDGHVLK